MIARVKATNYRCFKSLDFSPNPDLNIVVGDNEAGKSTLLEVISLLISGRVRGRRASEDLNPYWFNHDAVKAFFEALDRKQSPDWPEIDLEIFFEDETPGVGRLRGVWNSEAKEYPGLRLQVQPDPEHSAELDAYSSEEDLPRLIPSDLYMVTWKDFAGEIILRQPRGLGIALVNSNTTWSYSGVDYKLRQLIRDFVSPQESAKIALDHRKAKAEITSGILREVNERIGKEDSSFGVSLQMDQSASTNWDAVVAPHIEETPFSMLGQGRQVSTKIALAMSRTPEQSQFVLIEEPENHLSHTQLQRMLQQVNSLAHGRQLFVTTHSSFVLNRLGLKSLHLMYKSEIAQLDTPDITNDTKEYFQKQSGYDTLRLAIGSKVVIVEGPSDEMIFNLAYKIIKGVEPRDNAIDVITLGIRGKRALELGKALNRKMAVLRDNDGKEPSYWKDAAADLLETGKREYFIGDVDLGRTLEYQVVNTGDNEAKLRKILGLGAEDSVVETMVGGKTEWAWRVADKEVTLSWPQYFIDAIEFIHGD
ncbi:ATP-dependent nuclease [Enteractinococcus helveticum]|uniref:ATP-dependent endonuclease n=1 Tax=Enteractinococcus helveticum TaxID=1837282 RepID=A0A1B7M2S1_9MICC|nr:AAA family ATPase [Enteractinococcus helveticum]OAV62881.1 hypothetical protein A6F49_04285 [Enteractinococcus helveticum]